MKLVRLLAGAALVVSALTPVAAAHAAAPGSIAGTVTDGTTPLAGIEVKVWDNVGYGEIIVGQDVTNEAGAYQVDGVDADPYYKVQFIDPTGEHATEFYNDQISRAFATWVAVTGGEVNSLNNASLEPGSTLSGRLTRAGGAPVSSGTVTLWWRYGTQAFARVSDHVADADGRWTIPGVRGGVTYGLTFRDPVTGATEAWDDRPDVVGSTAVVVPVGEDVPDLDALLGGVVTNVSVPTITGTAQVGQTLTASSGWQPNDTTVTYRWVVGDDTFPGDDPRGTTYVPTAADVGRTIRVEATGTSGAGWTPATAWSVPTAPVAAAPVTAPPTTAPTVAPPVTVLTVVNERLPRIKGTVRVGRIMRVTAGEWTPYPKRLEFLWFAGGKPVKGATHQRLRLTEKLVGKRLVVRVTATAPGYEPLTVRTRRSDRVRR